MEHNVLRLCVCLPLAQSFNLTINLMGQIAQNRCYLLVRLIIDKTLYEELNKN